MLPKPTRSEPSWGDGTPVMRDGQYGITHLHLGKVSVADGDRALAEIVSVEVANNFQQDTINFRKRFDEVQAVWANKGRFEQTVAALIDQHERLAHHGGLVASDMIRVTSKLQRELSLRAMDYGIIGNAPTTDVVPSLLQIIGRVEHEPSRDFTAVPTEEIGIRKREVKEWRQWAVARGAESVKFRRAVRRAYDSTCVVCGLRLPSLGADSNPGIDAAHILPWSNFDLDQVANGLCLCKMHHWAFDESLIEIVVENGVYCIVVPPEARERVTKCGQKFSLDFLLASEGPIPEERLPKELSDRPHPEYLAELRRYNTGQ